MAQFNPREFVICGDNRQYYSYDGELYTKTFPKEWAENHASGTGPNDCMNCLIYGSFNGVFIGYCINCSKVIEYQGTRGRGITYGIELSKEELTEHLDSIATIDEDEGMSMTCNNVDNYMSAFDSYLKGIDLNDVGDKNEFVDTVAVLAAIEERERENAEYAEYYYNISHLITDESEDDEEDEEFAQTYSKCQGCYPIYQANQQGHMCKGGCLEEKFDDYEDELESSSSIKTSPNEEEEELLLRLEKVVIDAANQYHAAMEEEIIYDELYKYCEEFPSIDMYGSNFKNSVDCDTSGYESS